MQDSRSRLYAFFIAVYFAQGMVGVAYEPIFYLLKDVLKLTPAGSALFVACMSAPFLLKPFFGIVTDAFPILLKRRTPYLIASSLATFACWAALAGLGEYRYWPSLVLLTAVNVGICFADVLCDGVMVERGRPGGETGKFQAAQIGTLYLTLLATGVGGGWLAQNVSYRGIFALTSVFPLLIFAAALIVKEPPLRTQEPAARLAANGLRSLLASGRFWNAALVILLFNFSPFQGTSWFYYQTGVLEFSKLFIGTLSSIGGFAGVLGAWAFWKFYDRDVKIYGRPIRMETRTLIRLSVLAGVPLTLLFLAYRTEAAAAAITVVSGCAGVVMRLSLMDMAAKACPEHGEATAFALFMSVFNLAAWSSNTLGADAYERLAPGPLGPHGAMAVLILAAALCTLACWPLLTRIPSGDAAKAP